MKGPGPGRWVIKDPEFRYAQIPDKLLADHNVSSHAVRLWGIIFRLCQGEQNVECSRAALAAIGWPDCSVDTIDRAITDLVARGWLIKYRYGLGQPNGYALVSEPVDHPDDPSVAQRLQDHLHAGVRTSADSRTESAPVPRGVRTGADSLLSPRRGDSTTLPADSSSPQMVKPSRPRSRDRAEDDLRPRTGWAGREPPQDDGMVLGADAPPAPVQHRPASGAGCAAYFKRAADSAFAHLNLPPGQVDERKLASAIKTAWLGKGMDPVLVRATVDLFCQDAKPVPGMPLWRGLLASKDRLHTRAARLADTYRPAEEVYVDPPTRNGEDW